MPDSVSISSGIAARYATALFELSLEADAVDKLDEDVAALGVALSESEDLRSLITSPVYTRAEMASAITAIARRMDLSALTTNTLGLMAEKRRLFVLPALIESVGALIADHKGIVSVEVVTAEELDEKDSEALGHMLRERLGMDVTIDMSVDPELIGGLSARIGSRLIDASMRTKLTTLRNLMQEV